ncbi:MAG TPA: DUF695 domain-containing protein [Patescibacteria group bacterium]|nr:DUF695 domain-containing protein [Patescibacteria group bacterium]
MSKEWDVYACEIDGMPASVAIDLRIAEDAPLARLPVAAWVQLRLQSPGDDGLPSAGEQAALHAIEAALANALVSRTTAFVGHISTAGRRDFHFYTGAATGWKERVSNALQGCPGCAFTCGSRPDRDWGIYFERLSPSDEDQERIQNRRACDALQQGGERFEQARPIEHSAYFPDAASRERFILRAGELGHRVVETVEPEARGEQFGVRVSAVGIPSHALIDEWVLPLFHAAEDCGGEYDGWETQIIA